MDKFGKSNGQSFKMPSNQQFQQVQLLPEIPGTNNLQLEPDIPNTTRSIPDADIPQDRNRLKELPNTPA